MTRDMSRPPVVRRSARRVPVLVLMGLLAAACGSTYAADPSVDTASALADAGLGGPTLDQGSEAGRPQAPVPVGPAPTTATSSGTTQPQADPAVPAETVAPTAPAPDVATEPGRAAPTAPPGPGTEKAAKEVGFFLLDNNAGAAKSLGMGDLTNGDEQAMAQALVDHVNAQGGLAGHPIEPIFHMEDPNEGRSTETAYQAACATFTEDNDAFAVLNKFMAPTLYECAEQRGAVSINSAPSQGGADSLIARWPHYHTTGWQTEAMAELLANELVAQAYFDGSSGFGLIVEDNPTYPAVTESTLLPALARHGIEPDEIVYSPQADGSSSVGPISAAMSNAVLRFRSRGIDRVVFFVPWSIHPLTFMQAAEQQGYRPTYGVDTGVTPAALDDLVSPNQLRGAIGVGVSPWTDAEPDSWQVDPPGRSRCLSVLAEAGMEFVRGSSQEWTATLICDMVFLLDDAADRAPGPLSRDTLNAGAAALGGDFASAVVQGNRFGDGQRWGGTAYQRLAFEESCTCFRYTTPPLTTR